MKSQLISEEEFKYQLPSDEWLTRKIIEFEEFLSKCKGKICCEELEIEINYNLLLNVFVRIDERKDYFMYFHSEIGDSSHLPYIMHMSLEKEIALEAYWLVKYQPLRIKNIDDDIEFTTNYKASVNHVIAAMLIVAFLIDKESKLDNFFTAKKINTLIYDLFNRDISKEAMIMYVESFIVEDNEDEL